MSDAVGKLIGYGLVIALGIGVAGFLVQAFLVSTLFWGGPTLLLFIFTSLFENNKIFRLKPGGKLTEKLPIEFNGENLKWCVDEDKIDTFSGSMHLVWLAVVMTSIVTISILVGIYLSRPDIFPSFVWFFGTHDTSEETTLVLYSILSQVPIGGFVNVKYEDLQNSFESRAKSLVENMNRQIQRRKELIRLEGQVNSLYSQLDIENSVNYRAEIIATVDREGVAVGGKTAKLNNTIKNNIQEARKEKNNLEKAISLYNEVEKVYEETAHEVRKTGSVPLIKELEDDYQGLDSAQTKKLLKQKAWRDYHEVLGLLKEDLHNLAEVAKKYQEEGFEEFGEEKKEKTGSIEGEMTEELAYQVLGLQKQAPVEEIKKKKKKLTQVYHPDHNKKVSDGTMMKKINLAYDFLKEKRNF